MQITKIAIRHKGKVYAANKPARHYNLIHQIGKASKKNQGFIDPVTGDFMGRREAAAYAILIKQVKEEDMTAYPNLYSEDLW